MSNEFVNEVEKVAGEVKAEAVKLFDAAKPELVEIEGTLVSHLSTLEANVKTLLAKGEAAAAIDLKNLEAKIDALAAKLGIKF